MSIEDIYDEYDQCGRPVLLHKDPGEECTRYSDEGLKVIAKNWRDLKKRLKPIMKEIKAERDEERKQSVYLDGIEMIVNTLKMDIHPSNPHPKKDENTSSTVQSNKPKLLTKPAKVLIWTKDITLETYTKQIQTWLDVLEDISEHVKYADLIESLKNNK